MSGATVVTVVASTEFSGGAEQYIGRICESLHTAGLTVELVGALRTWPSEAGTATAFGDPRKWNLRRLPGGVLRLPRDRRRLAALARDRSGVFWCHFKREQIGYASRLARYGPVVWTEHGTFPGGVFGALLRPFYARASRYVDVIVCVSDVVARDISRVVAGRARVVTIETGVESPRPTAPSSTPSARPGLGFATDRPFAAYVGRLTASKRPLLAIESALAAGLPIVVAGDGPERASLEERYREQADVHLLGHVDRVEDVLRAAAVHLFTSDGHGEGMPLCLLEAASLGLPSVGADDSGFGEMVALAGGLVAPPQAAAMADAIHAALDAREQLSATALEWAHRHSSEAWSNSYLSLFRSIAGGRSDDGAQGIAR